MSNNKKIIARVNRLLEEKSKLYRKKYFALSFISETNVKNNEDLFVEAKCLVKSLKESNGHFPSLDYIFEFYQECLKYSGASKKLVNKRSKYLKNLTELKFKETSDNSNNVIIEMLESVNVSNKKLDSKLESVLVESFRRNINVVTEAYRDNSVVDLTRMFDEEGPSEETLSKIERDKSDKPEKKEKVKYRHSYLFDDDDDDDSLYHGKKFEPPKSSDDDEDDDDDWDLSLDDDDDFWDLGDEGQVDPETFKAFFGGKDPRKMSSKKAAETMGYVGDKWVKGNKKPLLKAWDKLVKDAMKKIHTGSSVEAKRKWFIIERINYVLVLQKSALRFLGLSEKQKGSMLSGDEYEAAVQYYEGEVPTAGDEEGSSEVVKFVKKSGKKSGEEDIYAKDSRYGKMRRSGTSQYQLSEEEIKSINDDLQELLLNNNFDLENPGLTERDLLGIFARATARDPNKLKNFREDLELMYPLEEDSGLEGAEKLSDEEKAKYLRQHMLDLQSSYEEDEEVYGDEVDPETGERLYANAEDIKKIKDAKAKGEVADLDIDEPEPEIVRVGIEEYKKIEKARQKDIARLRELETKQKGVEADIFAPFSRDGSYASPPTVIPAEDLSDEEIQEIEDILNRLQKFNNIEVVNADKRGEMYDALYARGATPEEFQAFMQTYGLMKKKPMTYRDIARTSYGKMRDTAAARQYALKAWFKGMYYSLAPAEKAKMYAQIGERWFERMEVLDLISDETKIPAASIKLKDEVRAKYDKMGDYFSKLPRHLNPKSIERYFNGEMDEYTLEEMQSVKERTSSYSEMMALAAEEIDSDPQIQRHAVLESLFKGTSAFRIFATTLLKEYYNDNMWSGIESDLAFAVKEYFQENYPGCSIGRSLQKGEKSGAVPKDEGRDLFNPIIYLVMQAVGLDDKDARVTTPGGQEQEQRNYFLGKKNKKGSFEAKVAKYNAENPDNGLWGLEDDGSYKPENKRPFGVEDVKELLDDMFSNDGTIGSEYARLRTLASDTTNEFITWLSGYDEAKLDQILVNSMMMSRVLRLGADPMNVDLFKDIGKETAKVIKQYKKDFAEQLTSDSFKEYLSDEYGYEPVDPKAKAPASAMTKNMA